MSPINDWYTPNRDAEDLTRNTRNRFVIRYIYQLFFKLRLLDGDGRNNTHNYACGWLLLIMLVLKDHVIVCYEHVKFSLRRGKKNNLVLVLSFSKSDARAVFFFIFIFFKKYKIITELSFHTHTFSIETPSKALARLELSV